MLRAKPALRNAWAVALALLLLASPVRAAVPDPAASGPTEIVLRVQTPAYTHDAGGVRVSGYGTNDVPGAPALPVWSTVVELPPAGGWTLSVEPGESIAIGQPTHLPAVPVPQPILPGPLGWSAEAERPAAVPVIDRPDGQIYGADAFYPAALVQPGPEQWQRGRRLLALRVFPFEYNPVAGVLRYHPDIRIIVRVDGDASVQPAGLSMTAPTAGPDKALNPAALPQANGGSLRIRTRARGMYRLTYADLVAAKVPVATVDPASFAVSYLGQPVDIRLIVETAGHFNPGDSVVFYAEPYQARYLNHNIYWFTYGGAGSPAMASRSATQVGPVVSEITSTVHVENDLNYLSNLARPKDVDHWFDLPLGSSYPPISYTLNLSDPVSTGQLVLRALANNGFRQTTDQSLSMRLNDHDAGTYAWSGAGDYLITTTVTADWLDSAPNQVGLWPGIGLLYPDWIEVTYPALARTQADRLYIEAVAPGAHEVAVAGLSTPDARVYDIRNPRHPVQLTTTQATPDGSTFVFHFWDVELPGPTYFVATDAALLAPLAVEPYTPRTPLLQSPANNADYIAIVHRSLWEAIDPLLARRANPTTGDGFRVAKVDVQEIYDEFSYGRVDPEAIRSFLTYAFYYWNAGSGPPTPPSPPQYVLLVGDGHYDFTGVSGTTLLNLIPPYLIDVDPWMGETAADNRYVSVDGPDDYLPDMHIGRIPAQTPADVAAAVDKVLAYETTAQPDDWQRRVVYVADNCADGAGDFQALSDASRLNWLPAPYDDRTIYYGNPAVCPESDYSTGAEMRTAIKGAFNNQALYLQWFGHASRFRWGSVTMFNIFDPPALDANAVWPVTMSYACWTGYFITLYSNLQALGETLLLTPQRGSVADLSPSGLHVGSVLAILNQGITEAIFQKRLDRVGQAVDAGKLYYYGHSAILRDVIDTSILFGDPALRLRLPPIISIERQAALVKLTWKHVPQYASYEVWRSTRAYFTPGDTGSELRGTVSAPTPGPDVVFEDGGAIGNPGRNYFYVVRGINTRGAPGLSNRVGEFDFAVTPGD